MTIDDDEPGRWTAQVLPDGTGVGPASAAPSGTTQSDPPPPSSSSSSPSGSMTPSGVDPTPPASPDPAPTSISTPTPTPTPTAIPASDAEAPPAAPVGGGRERGFWYGVLIGLTPFVLIVGAAAGYLLATRGGDDLAGDRSATNVSLPPSESSASLDAASSSASASAASTGSADAPTSFSSSEEGSGSSSPVSAPSASAAGRVDAVVLRVDGSVPSGSGPTWLALLDGHATALGLRFEDATDVADDIAADSELTVEHAGAVVFVDGSDTFFENDPAELFDSLADVLDTGEATLTIRGYIDDSTPAGVGLAITRALHIEEHLLDEGVDAARLTTVTLAPDRALEGSAAPAGRRIDLVIHFGG